jgi:putative tricarboxylic transport membrane protein
MSSSLRDGIFASAIAALAMGYLYMDLQLPHQLSGDPVGPKIYPFLVGIGLLVSALMMLSEAARKPAAKGPNDARVVETAEDAQRPYHKYIVIAAAALWLLVYYAVLEWLGYLIATTVFLFVLLLHFNPRHILVNALIAVGFACAVFELFTGLLSVDLPRGLLAF